MQLVELLVQAQQRVRLSLLAVLVFLETFLLVEI
jgi:hypothetical protein